MSVFFTPIIDKFIEKAPAARIEDRINRNMLPNAAWQYFTITIRYDFRVHFTILFQQAKGDGLTGRAAAAMARLSGIGEILIFSAGSARRRCRRIIRSNIPANPLQIMVHGIRFEPLCSANCPAFKSRQNSLTICLNFPSEIFERFIYLLFFILFGIHHLFGILF